MPTLPSAVSSLLIDQRFACRQPAAGTLGLALATKGFQAVLGFLESARRRADPVEPAGRHAEQPEGRAQGRAPTSTSSPTSSGGHQSTAGNNNNNGTTTLPTLTLTPFFSRHRARRDAADRRQPT
ncbi:MAG: hypothetical protein V9G29_11815 [Burkholderiaceae bacterium]